jgi:hypothetical protein
MDDPENRAGPRNPRLEDLVKICQALNANQAEYVVIGGFAIALNGFYRNTKDIDFLVNPAPENIRKMKAGLSVLHDNAAAQVDDHDVLTYNVVRIGDEVIVDLLGKACGVDYAMVRPNIETRIIDGVTIPLPDKQTLIKTKDTVRPHDKADCYALRCLIAEEEKLKK